MDTTAPAANATKPDEAPKSGAITRTTPPRGLNQRPILVAGILVLMALSAGAYVYSVWDTGQNLANRLKSEPAVSAAAPAATPVAATTPAPSIAAAPKPSDPPREPVAQAPAATQAPVDVAPVAEPAPPPPAPLQQQPASLPKEDVVFVQKPGVRMRSEPTRQGKVIGGAPKGSQFKVVGRAGSWVQVEGDAGRGWIGGRMLGAQAP